MADAFDRVAPKQKLLLMLEQIPDDVSLDELIRSLHLFASIERGMEDIARGEVYTTEEVREHLKEWARSRGLELPSET